MAFLLYLLVKGMWVNSEMQAECVDNMPKFANTIVYSLDVPEATHWLTPTIWDMPVTKCD